MDNPVNPNAVAFMVVSCDKYADLWDPFFHCFRKYWPDCPYPIYLVTNEKECREPGVTVIQIGEDKSYSDNLKVAISRIKEPWVILWLEDVMLSQTVQTERLQNIIQQAQSIPVGYLKIGPDLPLSYSNSEESEIGPIPVGVRYRSAVGIALYQIETLKKLLIPGASAWELDTSRISDGLKEPFYALTSKAARRPPIIWVNGVIKGKWYWPSMSFLRREGFASALKNRNRQSLTAFLYIQMFLFHNFILRKMKKHWY